jgi:hypothetical protein
MKEIIFNQFNGGMTDDVRQMTKTGFTSSAHFDIFTNPKRLVPYYTQTTETSDNIGTYNIGDYLYSSTGRLYAKGENQPTNARTKIMYKADPTSLAASSWTFPANATGGGVTYNWSFIEYKNYLWGLQGLVGGKYNLFKYGDITGSPTFTDSVLELSGTILTTAQGIIGEEDECYLFYNNIIVKIIANGTASEITTVVPTTYKITSVDVYGSYLAIGCSPLDSTKNSKLYLWDYVSADATEIVDFGEGQLTVIGNIDGRIIGVSAKTVFSHPNYYMVIRSWSGGQAQVFKELEGLGLTMRSSKVIKNNKLYWVATFKNNDNLALDGIWVFGRKDINSDFAVTLDTVQDLGVNSVIFTFFASGQYWHISFSDGGTRGISTTGSARTTVSFWESPKIQSDGEAILKAVAMNFNALPAAGQIILKYRKQGQTSWTTIHTETTDSQTGFESTQLDTGASLPTFQEIQFRIESTGGAEPFEFKCKFTENNTLYSNIK